jgi:hypothetical protein
MMSPVRTMVAKVRHQIPDRPSLQLAVGERVDVGDRDSEWPEFVFVTASHGTGWVPARHLSGTSGTVVVQTAYDTSELPTQAGDVVEVVAEDLTSGWLWCRTRDGRGAGCPSRLFKQPSRLSPTNVHNNATPSPSQAKCAR